MLLGTRLRRLLVLPLIVVLLPVGSCGSSHPEADAFIRVDQIGYAPGEQKIAVLMAPRDAAGARATVIDASGDKVLDATIGARRAGWNDRFPDVRPVDLSALTRPGTYKIRVEGGVRAESVPFRVGNSLFDPLVRDAVGYFQAHRDGADQVSGPFQRQPAHLADRAATIYETPDFDDDGTLTGELTGSGGPVDVEGGWYDAGDFLKFTHTTAYALIAMLVVQRDGSAVDGLAAETRHGLDWLTKMWNPQAGVLYTQVGIGSGLSGSFLGDHDTWRLPQADDQLDVQPGDDQYYQRYRPVFRAAASGEPLSPNLAGRVAAAFALAAQVRTGTDRALATRYLALAAQIYDAAGSGGDTLVTAEPRSFYPEDSWADDMALGATELALAGAGLGDPRTAEWLRTASSWASGYMEDGGTETLSVYDVSVLADAELARIPGADTDALRADLEHRLDAAVKAAATNPMSAAAGNGGSDYAARQLGFTAAAELYQHTFHDNRYAAFATAQRGVVLGANGWGTSLVVGAGTTYPRCPHDQIASLAGTSARMTGAVVNGPNDADRVLELLDGPEPSPCATGSLAAFDRDDAHYVDDTRVSATNEPSIDFTATGLLAFALIGRLTAAPPGTPGS
ncbi:glycoside hydrolase family 9 protein [Winogradskya consettensis]|uniref:Hydrolase n=1 Tax=Winogradskya consettensis TaxID=113560 RepID=A0A919SF47_9ACTN|nr:glycoside hydrolase family 9 protein [Actinoplanes consettensis]GIM70472.1 hydrolase [Actinoplanes consettensis]